MRRRICVTLLVASALLAARTGLSWWAEGHEVMARAALRALPDDVPSFFRKGGDAVVSASKDPDLWREPTTPALRAAEAPNHYLDLELLAGRELPPDRHEFLRLCAELKLSPASVGALPYAIVEWHDRLALAFAQYRRRPRDPAVRAKVLYTAGVLSHYTADAAQPLHCTVHYDGRLNPDGSSPRSGVHLRMDALPGVAGLRAGDLGNFRAEPVEDVFALAVTAIRESNRRVDRVYELEDRLPDPNADVPPAPDEEVRGLALECAKAGAELTAAVWYSAWEHSAQIELPPWGGE